MQQYQQEVAAFLQDWVETKENNKQGFERFYKQLQDKQKGSVEFHPRPGVTYSLRGMTAGKEAPVLYVMVDVIEDEPRWLSVCFYGAMITDPEEKERLYQVGFWGKMRSVLTSKSITSWNMLMWRLGLKRRMPLLSINKQVGVGHSVS